jgi:hypothetical protein
VGSGFEPIRDLKKRTLLFIDKSHKLYYILENGNPFFIVFSPDFREGCGSEQIHLGAQ